jgi:hypothetical protein
LLVEGFSRRDLKDVVPVLAAIGAATIPLGFSIGTFGVFLLKALASISWRIWSKGTRQVYEAWLSPCCFRAILLVTKAPDDPWDNMRPNLLYATATFDHELLPKGIHEWLRRRFNAFIVAFNSALAIGLSLVFVGVSPHFYSFPFEHSCGADELQLQQQMGWTQMKSCWLLVNLALLVLLLWAAHRSWRDTMKMIEFQARRMNVGDLGKRVAAGSDRRPEA